MLHGSKEYSSVTNPLNWVQKYKYTTSENVVNFLQTIITANSIAVGVQLHKIIS